MDILNNKMGNSDTTITTTGYWQPQVNSYPSIVVLKIDGEEVFRGYIGPNISFTKPDKFKKMEIERQENGEFVITLISN